jgi:autotransporter-associated beta strand protein
LSGGLLSSDSEYVGVYGTGTFTQTGGTNSTDSLTIGSKGTYTLSGGILNLGGDVINNGIFDLANSYATINVNAAITNVSNWNVRNATNASLNADSYSLLFVSAGFDPSHYFGHFNNAGIIHQIGTTLTISSIYNISSKGIINDFVDCQGSLVATTGNSIMLNGGVFVSGNGNVNLGSGELRVDNAISGVSGGQLSAYYEYVGNSGTGSFTQSGGTHSVSNYFYLGYKTGSSGSYNLIGGQLTSYDEYVGGSGSGKVTQAGGVNTIRNALYLGGYTTGSSGLYNLNGGQLISSDEYVGYLGSGNITQTGGANIISGSLLLGCYSRTSGIYNLNGGTLCLKGLEKGSGIAVFNFGGGTLLANGSFTSSLLMTLTGMNGEAHIDTNGYNVTLSGALSGPGGLNKLGAGTLTLSTTESFSGDTIVNGGTLVFSGGIASSGTSLINVDSGKVVLQTTNITKPDLEIITGATGVLEIASGSHTLDTISGSGSTIVDKGASLTVSSIVQNTLTIGSSSGTAVQSYSATTIDNSIAAVPEPGTLVLLTFSCLLFLARKKFA